MSAIQQILQMIKKVTVTVTNKWVKEVPRESNTTIRWINGTAISVGGYGQLKTSTDGKNWTNKSISNLVSGTILYDISWNGSVYTLVGTNTTLLTSTDLINWTSSNSGLTNKTISATAAGGSRIVIGTTDGIIKTSDDNGATWTQRTSNVGGISKIIYAGGQYVSAGSTTTTEIAVSSDGITWTKRTLGTNCYCNDIAYDGGSVYIIAGQVIAGNGAIIKSTNGGASFSVQASGLEPTITNAITSICWAGDRFVIGYNNGTSISTDAAGGYFTWTQQQNTGISGPMCYDGSKIIGQFNYGTMLSTNGLDWQSILEESSATNNIYSSWTSNTNFMVKYAGSKYFTFYNNTSFYVSDNGNDWIRPRFSNTPTATFLSVAYAGSTWVAVGTSGAVYTSTDALYWTARTSGTTNQFYDIATDGTTFVAVGVSGTVRTSTDGITWTGRTVTGTNNIVAVAYGNGRFVAVGPTTSYVSTDGGTTWSTITQSTLGPNSEQLIYTGQHFMCSSSTTGSGGLVRYSTDGVTWLSKSVGLAAASSLQSIATDGNGKIVVFGNLTSASNAGAYSTDYGSTWATMTTKNSNFFTVFGCVYANSRFLASSNYSIFQQSTDGINWSLVPRALSMSNYGLFIKNDEYYAVPGYGTYPFLFKSVDSGKTWEYRIVANSTSINASDVIWDGSQFVVAGGINAPGIYTSPNGITWTSRTITAGSSTTALRSIAYNGSGTYVVCNGQGNSNNGGIWTSTDGAVTWTKTSVVAMSNRVRWLGGQFIAVGYDGSNGLIYTSPDGITWTRVAFVSGVTFTDVAYSGSKWVAVASVGTARIYTSTDSVTWNSLAGSTGYYCTSVMYGNNTFVAIGNSNSYVSTDNASTWTSVSANSNGILYDIMWDGTKFISCQNGRGGLYSYTPA